MEARITVANPVVEMDGDEMARVMWQWIKDELIFPYLDLPVDYYDLSIQHREATKDRVTVDAAAAIGRIGVGIKCATITPDEQRVKEFGLSEMWKSPNATIRNQLGGTIFRAPILVENIPRAVPSWEKPIFIGRHAFGDQYKASEMRVPSGSKVELVCSSPDGSREEVRLPVASFRSDGVCLAMFNEEDSVRRFADHCFNFALDEKVPVFLSTKNTVLKKYDGMFKDVFQKRYDELYKTKFEAAGLLYEHRLIDDMVAFSVKSKGGFLWACKNYDGDVQSDFVAQGFGSLGLMVSVLFAADGVAAASEAAHGTVTRHFRMHQRGEQTSTNPTASIFAWTRGLKHRAKLDGNRKLAVFCERLESACLDTIRSGVMTKDLALCIEAAKGGGNSLAFVHTLDFIRAVRNNLNKRLQSSS